MSAELTVVTPHFGDAVAACGELIAAHPGAIVVTVFAAIPSDSFVVPEWDAACGFASPQQAVTARRREDRGALDALDAEPCWLACRDSLYRRTGERTQSVAMRISRALRRRASQRIAIPLGLVAGDHDLAHAAALTIVRRRPDVEWVLYEDGAAGEEVVARRVDLLGKRLALEPYALAPDPWRHYRKRRALECYESLLRGCAASGRAVPGLSGDAERYWIVRP